MGIFDFLRIPEKQPDPAGDGIASLVIKGPAYLRNLLQPVVQQISGLPKFSRDRQFMGKLVSDGDSRFSLTFYGDLSPDGLIIDQDQTPLKLIATGENSGEEVVLFDKACHGWEGSIAGA